MTRVLRLHPMAKMRYVTRLGERSVRIREVESSSLFRSAKTEQAFWLAPFFVLDWRLQLYISCAAAGDGVK